MCLLEVLPSLSRGGSLLPPQPLQLLQNNREHQHRRCGYDVRNNMLRPQSAALISRAVRALKHGDPDGSECAQSQASISPNAQEHCTSKAGPLTPPKNYLRIDAHASYRPMQHHPMTCVALRIQTMIDHVASRSHELGGTEHLNCEHMSLLSGATHLWRTLVRQRKPT